MIAVAMAMARPIISTAMTIAWTTMIAGSAMITTMATMITTATDLNIDALSCGRGRRSADIEKAGSSQQS